MASMENTQDTSGDAPETKEHEDKKAPSSDTQPTLKEQIESCCSIQPTSADQGDNACPSQTKSDEAAASSSATAAESTRPVEHISFKVMFNKQKYPVTFDLDRSVTDLKKHLETITNVPASMQKLMFRGLLKDGQSLRQQKLHSDSKVMLIGSTVSDVISVNVPDPKVMKELENETASGTKESLCTQKPHKTVLDKYGKPDDLPVGVKHRQDALPLTPLSGMYNKSGGKVRLTFKLEEDQLWIGTKERTEKLPMGSIKAVISEPIIEHEEYHIMALQLGPTEASRYWIYWVPAQYTDAIKDAILGSWQIF